MKYLSLKGILIILPLVTALLLGHYVFINSLYYDEINPLAFVYNTVHFPNLIQIIGEIFSYHHEHVLFFVKIVFLIDYFFHQAIDLKEIIYFGTILFAYFLFQIYKSLKLNLNESVLLSLLVFLPMFWDMYLNPLAIQNIFVLIFVIGSLQKIRENKINLSGLLMVCGFFSSAQGLLLLPIWLFFAFRKKAKLLQLIAPTGIAILLFMFKPSDNNALSTSPLIEFSNHQKMKLLWTYLSPPFNKGYLILQVLSFLFFSVISFNFCKNVFKEKLDFTSENHNEVIIGLIVWSAACMLSSFFLRLNMENRYYLYSALTFYLLLLIFLRQNVGGIKRFTPLLILLALVHFFFNLYVSIVPLKNLYLERRFNYLNYKSNYMANYFPNAHFREMAKQIKNGKVDLVKPKIFHIPSGITGAIPEHLQVFNEFIPFSFQVIQFDPNTDLNLLIKNLEVKKEYTISNTPTEQLKKLIDIKVKGDSFRDVYYVKLSNNKFTYYFQLKEEANSMHQIEIYSNQIPFETFKISFIKGKLAIN